jgi:predicted extracellular nuclease
MKIILLILLSITINNLHSQTFKVMFYNVENFFDLRDDPNTNDDSFTPSGANRWNMPKFIKKRDNIYKAVVAAGQGQLPHIIGLCEIENRYVLQQLITQTPLAKYNYGIVHYDSPDRRGIDVALLYMKDSFDVITSRSYKAPILTRDILYVKGKTADNDTLHFFVNHWPSKWGGAASEDSRMTVATLLKHITDSIFNEIPNVNICIMGDFNDYPDSRPLQALGAKPAHADEGNQYLYNMSLHLHDAGQGSIKYQNRWELIDLFLVSGNLLFNKTGLSCSKESIEIYRDKFLTETVDGKEESPRRTYRGTVYIGGFSDHLPVVLTFSKSSGN